MVENNPENCGRSSVKNRHLLPTVGIHVTHPFVVFVEERFDSRFSNLVLAAQTAVARGGHVCHEETGQKWTRIDCLVVISKYGRTPR